MGLKKGQTNNPAGRTQGIPNKATKGMRERITAFLSDNWGDMSEEFKKLDAKDKFQFYTKLLSFSIPTLQAVQQNTILESKLDVLTEAQLDKLISQLIENE